MRKWRALAVLTLALVAACVLIDELQVQIDGEYQPKPCLFLLRRVSDSQCSQVVAISRVYNLWHRLRNFSAGCNVNPASILNETLQISS